jgi:hypothetical protein
VPSAVEYGNTFGQQTVWNQVRLCIGLDDAHDAALRELAVSLSGPFQLLYVLHTTRTGADLGRYQSPELTAVQVTEFLVRFGPFLAQDSRHDFWLRSHDDDATIVLDRHNLIYAYGQLEMFEATLVRIGASARGVPGVPYQHLHHYHSEWDDSERAILAAFPWTHTPLRDSDIQYRDGEQPG